MVKRILPCLLFLAVFVPIVIAGFGDADDGYLTAGEYDYAVDWTSHTPPLIVDGGGAEWIEVTNSGRINVLSTSTPLSSNTGIQDILLNDNSQLLFLDGIVEEVIIKKDATATLKGGRIDYIRSQQIVDDSPHITIECRPGWSWMYNSSNEIKGIMGLWANDTGFDIEFFDDDRGAFPPTWQNINVVEIPEPATLILLGVGGLLIRRKK